MFSFSSDTGAGVPLAIRMRPVDELRPYAGNARTHSRSQIRQIADSITRFGFTNPVLTDDAGGIIAGHGRVAAAKLLGIAEVPTVCLSHLSVEEQRAYILADNKLAENAGWDREILAIELQGLLEVGFDLELTVSRWRRSISAWIPRATGRPAAPGARICCRWRWRDLRSPGREISGASAGTGSSAGMRGTRRWSTG